MPAAIVQTAPLFRLLDNWENHKQTFEDYKIHGIQPDIYGRDADLSHPDVFHIHLAQDDATVERWSKIRSVPYRRTHSADFPELDYWLIYAFDDIDNKYLLLTIMGPDAHSHEKYRKFLSDLSVRFVQPWIVGRGEGIE